MFSCLVRITIKHMIPVSIPGFGDFSITAIVMDYNGTLAVDGKLLPGLREVLLKVSEAANLHVVTADTFGLAARELEGVPCTLKILEKENQKEAKHAYIISLGVKNTAAIGNGRNDSIMLKNAVLGIAVLQEEGAASETLVAADVVCRNVFDALNLFIHPKRLIASLRS